MSQVIWQTVLGKGALIAAAIHDGHNLRPEVARLMALSDVDRRREEDPYTGDWTGIAGTQIVGLNSRFEVDLNRPRERAVYRKPEDAWGLKVWKEELPEAVVAESLREYDAFYDEARRIFTDAEEQHGRFVVYDLHTYNYRRAGPNGEPASPDQNPEVNIGTGTLDRALWGPVIDRFLEDLRGFDFGGRHLDVRENVKFRGGRFSGWIHQTFPASGCSLAIEFKKFFMDEWTGKLDESQHELILAALRSTVPGVLAELRKLSKR